MAKVQIHQIFYDEATRRGLDPAFLPLDNTASARPDWFEFHPIRKFLRETALDDGTWYGFLSPKFSALTGVSSAELTAFLAKVDAVADVALVSHGWDQIAYFLNPFEQGEYWHPGLLAVARQFLPAAGIDLDLGTYVSHSQNTVFSNYLVAKPVFWRQWLGLADRLYELAEGGGDLSKVLAASGKYEKGGQVVQVKVFIQERIASVLLARERFRVAFADTSARTPLNAGIFEDTPRTRRLLATCDTLKLEYSLSGDRTWLDMFSRLRASIPASRRIIPRPP